jgi:hypothetical protein
VQLENQRLSSARDRLAVLKAPALVVDKNQTALGDQTTKHLVDEHRDLTLTYARAA